MFLVAGVLTAAQPKTTESTRTDSPQQAAAALNDGAEARQLDLVRVDRLRRSYEAASSAPIAPAEPTATKPAEPTATKPAEPTATKPAEVKVQPSRKPAPAKPAPRTAAPAPVAAGNLAAVINFALSQVGKPYVYGAAGPYAYDCSGLVMAAFARIGIFLPHQSEQIAGRGTYVPQSQWQPGTVLHWPGHVAIYLGGGRMVHASRPGVPVAVAAVYGSPSGYRIG
jgi:cell wall-associated NlpC family hydrolase